MELPGEIHLSALVVATPPGQRRLATMAFHIVRSLSCLMNSGERLKSINRIKTKTSVRSWNRGRKRYLLSPSKSSFSTAQRESETSLSRVKSSLNPARPVQPVGISRCFRAAAFFVRTPRLTRYQHFNVMGNTITIFRASITRPGKILVPRGADLHYQINLCRCVNNKIGFSLLLRWCAAVGPVLPQFGADSA